MNAEDRVRILNAVAPLSSLERHSICVWAPYLITSAMNAEDRVRILNAVTALPSLERDSILLCTSLHITDTMNTEHRLELLNLASSLSPEERGAGIRFRSESELIVDRDKLEENPREILENLMTLVDKEKLFPNIRYKTAAGIDTMGIDAGGMSRGVVTDLMQALWHPKRPNEKLLPIKKTEKGVVPLIQNAAEDLKSYQSIGMIFAMALNGTKSILTGNHFDPILFQMIHALTQEELDQIPKEFNNIRDVPQPILNKILKLYLKSELSLAFGKPDLSKEALELAINNFVDNNEINEWMSSASEIETREGFFLDQKLNEILSSAFVIAKAMQQYVGSPWDLLIQGMTPEELRKRIEGSLDKAQVKGSLRFNDPSDKRKTFLESWIDGATEKELEKFVVCISNGTTLTQGQRLTVNVQPNSPNVPVFHTCAFQMDLPKYDDYETFKAKLALSIKFIMEGNIIGLA